MFFRPISSGMIRWSIWPSVSSVSSFSSPQPSRAERVPLAMSMRSRSLKA
jgi:hypothetical protein